MSSIKVRQGEGLVVVYSLDDCGRADLGATKRLILNEISEVTWEDSIDEGDQVTERNFVGKKFYASSGCDELQWAQIGITTGGMIPALETLLLAANAKMSGGAQVGFGRVDTDCKAAVAIEVLVQLDADTCGLGSVEPPTFAILFPLVKQWRPSGGGSLNGSNLIKPQYSGRGYKNALLASEGASDNELPNDLSHWDNVWEPEEWYTVTLFESSDLDFGALAALASTDPQTFA